MNLYSKIIMPIMAIVLIILSFMDKSVWQLGLFFTAFLILLNIEQIKIFKLGKDGLELERITQEAKETIDELKSFANYIYKPLLTIAPKMGRYGTALRILEQLELKNESESVLNELGIEKNVIEERTKLMNNYILFDILSKAVDKLNGKDNERYSLISKEYLQNVREKSFNPNIDGIENSLKNSTVWNDEIKQILEEARYFKKHKDIKTPSLFKK